eukprot:3198184-Alexandrium_andersonii.AAC.1
MCAHGAVRRMLGRRVHLDRGSNSVPCGTALPPPMAKTSRKRVATATIEIKSLAAARKSVARTARRVKGARPR